MLRKIIAGAAGALNALNGVLMLADGRHWYDTVPGVTHTGPFNPHFVADIGAAFLVAGLALLARAWRPRYWPAALAGAGFLALHGVIHLQGFAADPHHDPTGLLLVSLPSALGLWAAFPQKGENYV